ncbi:glyceraldehyde-3-phosphate dehydrogenase [Psychromonas marina]|uniref:Glyceraldehyde-3-phosphate dehydrogenase n=1 Tax=Psychromonas marina TaxID=88364 RepID=A0ABQ6E020_9GAMM|nr:BamA/TamA family outer membrane protein [Psychromonas marina]GLS90784.1 glyceraldehyde-3-phosphate dehydrogenase [Psychromonas marina]
MKKNKFLYSTILLQSLFIQQSHASFFDPIDGQFDIGQHLAENAYGFLPIPILITEPAVGYGGGVMGLFLHESQEDKDKRKALAETSLDGGAQLMPAAITLAGAAGTANGTWFAFAGHQHSWLKDSIRYIGGGGVGKANLDIYYDFSSGKTLKFNTETEGIFGFQKLQFRIAQTPLMLGMKQIIAKSSVSSDSEIVDGFLKLFLGEDSFTSGLGVTAVYDTRNNIFFPTNGYSVGAEYMIYDDAIGSDWNYHNFDLSGEGYIPLAEKWILAFAGNYQYFSSDETFLPPTVRPYVDLRGVPSYRYQGDEVAAIQSQITYKITPRWLVSAFYGKGFTTTSRENDLIQLDDVTDSIDAYGVGFRYQIARRYGLYLGADIASSGDDNALYFNVGSGF